MINIPSNTTIVGELRSAGKVRIDGRMEGLGEIDGLLTLTADAVWKGKLTADTIIINGIFEGDVIARRRLIVGERASITGSVVAPAMSIAEGGKVEGHMRIMHPERPVALLKKKAETPRLLPAPGDKRTTKVVNIGR